MEQTISSAVSLNSEIKNQFSRRFGNLEKTVLTSTPASIVILGDHTHYNSGLIITFGVDRHVSVALRKINEKLITCLVNGIEYTEFINNGIEINENDSKQLILLKNILKLLNEDHVLPSGFECSIMSDVEEEIGVGENAAFLVGFMKALKKAFNLKLKDKDILNYTIKAEYTYLGSMVNPAHHLTVMHSSSKFMIIDLKNMQYRNIGSLPDDLSFLICSTGKSFIEGPTLCNERIEECKIGVDGLRLYIWGIKSLRDVKPDFLEKHVNMLPKRIYSRCYYNVEERLRVEEAIKALRKGDFEEFGSSMIASHFSLSGDYELSCSELDFLVGLCNTFKGVLGAKMISCSPKRTIICLVRKESANSFKKFITKEYGDKYNTKPGIIEINNADGSGLLRLV